MNSVDAATTIPYVDVELTSLNRLENIIATLFRILREERQRAVVTVLVTFTAQASSTMTSSFAGTDAVAIASRCLISRVSAYLNHDYAEETGESAAPSVSSTTADDITAVERDMLERINALDRKHDEWLHDRVRKFSWYKARVKRKREVSRCELSVSTRSRFDDAIDRLRILPRFHDDVSVSNADTPSSLKLGVFLFLQWVVLLASIHDECPHDLMHFEWLPREGVVRVYLIAPSSTVNSEMAITTRRNDGSETDTAIVAGNDDNGTWDTLSLASCAPLGSFVFSDGREIVREDTRSKNRPVRVVDERQSRRSHLATSHYSVAYALAQGNCLTVLKNTATAATELTAAAAVDATSSSEPLVQSSVRFVATELTREQKRIIDTLDSIWSAISDHGGNHSSGDGGNGGRVVVDGVAGSGKTFLLGLMLRRFPSVLYLVKKRNFIDATKKRFCEFGSKLRTQTIDAYLMRLMNIRVLHTWLAMRQNSLHVLKERLRRIVARNERNSRRLPSADDPFRSFRRSSVASCAAAPEQELIFVDEFSLIESSLADLLNIALRDRFVLMVGDCNQQPAIGEREDQSVRTMLGYENICFMYENVRARDTALLRRLACFTARNGGGSSGDVTAVDSLAALRGLSRRSVVDMRPFFDSMRCIGYNVVSADYNLLPRLIVTSNERVNYANWAMGYLMWRNCPVCHGYSSNPIDCDDETTNTTTMTVAVMDSNGDRDNGDEDNDCYVSSSVVASALSSLPLCCLRYKRNVIVTSAKGYSREGRPRITEGGEQQQRPTVEPTAVDHWREEPDEQEDDAYADEHFVIVGMRYRMIHARASWPMQVGSRVIVRAILSTDTVFVETDDEKRIACRLRKTRVKPYEYGSKWRLDVYEGSDKPVDRKEYSLYMFPFVMDAATTVYQVQGLTFDEDSYHSCYVDVYGMNDKALYVTLSRFQSEKQIRGVINCNHLCQ